METPALSAQRVQPHVDHRQILWILTCAANDEGFRDTAINLLSPGHLSRPDEYVVRLLWESIIEASRRFTGVTYEALLTVFPEVVGQPIYQQLTQDIRDSITAEEGWMSYITRQAPEIDETGLNVARESLQRLFHERQVVEALRRATGIEHGIPAHLSEVVDDASRQLQRAAATQSMPEGAMFPDVGTELAPSAVLVRTGTDFIDRPLGGLQQGDVLMLLGSTGSGKSTLGINMCINMAKIFGQVSVAGGDDRYAGYLTYEEPYERLRDRFWSHACQIPRRDCLALESWDQLSTRDTIKPYELNLQSTDGEVLSEIERYQTAVPVMRDNLKVLDMSGSPEFPNSGNGHIPEMVSLLQRIQDQQGKTPGFLVIDWVGEVCMRYLRNNGQEDDGAYRKALKEFAGQARVELAQRFNCPVLLIHQLKGSLRHLKPHKLFNANEAEGSADMAVQVTTCLTLSNPDEETRCRFLNFPKTRFIRGEAGAVQPIVLQLDRFFATYSNVSANYNYSESVGQFVRHEQGDQIQGLAESPAQSGPPDGIVSNNRDPGATFSDAEADGSA